jgi:AraC-like DNA-binding protein
MLAGPYGAWIHHGERNDLPRPAALRTSVCYYLVAVYSGTAVLTTDIGGEARLDAPCAFLLPPGGAHRVNCPAAARWELLAFDVVHVPLRRIRTGTAREHVRRCRQPTPIAVWGIEPPVTVPPADCGAGLDTVRFCGRHWWRGDANWVRVNARLHEWLTGYALAGVAAPAAAVPPPADPWLVLVEETAAAGLESGGTATDLACALGLSREHLRRRLAVHGTTPRALLTRLRMRRARDLLEDTTHDLTGIARFSGYRSASAFIGAFKRAHGCTPGRWRTTQRGRGSRDISR